MKFSARKIRAFLKTGMLVTVKTDVNALAECETGLVMRPGDIGTVTGIKCPVIRIIPGERRPFDEFVSVRLWLSDENHRMSYKKYAVSYDNIQLLGFLHYLPDRDLDKFLTDLGEAHLMRWTGIYETYMLVKFTAYDGSTSEIRYSLGPYVEPGVELCPT